ncbi:MAG: NAD(P)/FAD-dependent oxidoreductase [Myxococcota bacterium]
MSEKQKKKKHLVVVGGGAAGFFAALRVAECAPAWSVTLLEAARSPLQKVRISGGGRCNVTHACFEPASLVGFYPRGGKALRGAFAHFQPRDTVDWFAQRGIRLKTEADGRMFPTTDDSSTIIRCFLDHAERLDIDVRTRVGVEQIERRAQGFVVQTRKGASLAADAVLLTTGSSPQGHRIAKSLGHTVVDAVPSLFTFNIPDRALHQRSGVSVEDAEVRLALPGVKKLMCERGPVLVTHWGLSGPAVLKLSAWAARALAACDYQTHCVVNWLSAFEQQHLRAALLQHKREHPRQQCTAHPLFGIPKRLWQYLLQRCAIDTETSWQHLPKKAMHRILHALQQCDFQIRGKSTFKEEFVTCGGIALDEVHFKTMQSRRCEGLYFAGEILNIDGITGGFNFQSAWTTGWIAGSAIATSHDS